MVAAVAAHQDEVQAQAAANVPALPAAAVPVPLVSAVPSSAPTRSRTRRTRRANADPAPGDGIAGNVAPAAAPTPVRVSTRRNSARPAVAMPPCPPVSEPVRTVHARARGRTTDGTEATNSIPQGSSLQANSLSHNSNNSQAVANNSSVTSLLQEMIDNAGDEVVNDNLEANSIRPNNSVNQQVVSNDDEEMKEYLDQGLYITMVCI